jgi:hypothetical protein
MVENSYSSASSDPISIDGTDPTCQLEAPADSSMLRASCSRAHEPTATLATRRTQHRRRFINLGQVLLVRQGSISDNVQRFTNPREPDEVRRCGFRRLSRTMTFMGCGGKSAKRPTRESSVLYDLRITGSPAQAVLMKRLVAQPRSGVYRLGHGSTNRNRSTC